MKEVQTESVLDTFESDKNVTLADLILLCLNRTFTFRLPIYIFLKYTEILQERESTSLQKSKYYWEILKYWGLLGNLQPSIIYSNPAMMIIPSSHLLVNQKFLNFKV